MPARILSPAAVEEIWQLRSVLNEWGEPLYTGAHIAQQIGVSEATVWRVLKKRAAYMSLGTKAQDAVRFNALLGDTLAVQAQARPDLDQRAAQSQAKMLAELEQSAAALTHEVPAAYSWIAAKPPMNPLEE